MSSNSPAPNQCSQCHRTFSSRNQLFAHIRKLNHYGNAEDEEEADTDKQDAEPTSDGEASNQCNQCHRTFASRNQMFAHIRSIHRDDNAEDGVKADTGKQPAPNECNECHRTFASRNQMFAHIRKTHYGNAEDGGEEDTGKGDAEPTSDAEDEDDDDEEEEEDDEDDDEDMEPPTNFRPWHPFRESPYDSSEGSEQLKEHLEALHATSDWDEKLDITVNRILKPFLDQQRPKFSGWPEQELKRIFRDAEDLPALPRDATRYFCKKNSDGNDCEHYPADECWCYFDATASAGILGLSQPGRGIRKDRKACIAFMHGLVTQFLIILAESKMELWDDEEKWTLHDAIKMTNPSPDDEEHKEDEEDDEDDYYDDERTKYLDTDSALQDLALNKSDEDEDEIKEEDEEEDEEEKKEENEAGNEKENEEEKKEENKKRERTEDDLLFLRLCGTLGRRMLTLGVCLVGDGLYFVKKRPIRFWDVAGLVQALGGKGPKSLSNDHLKESPRVNVDKPLYPTRVINTHTYEFEDDILLYHNNYAILSHTWTTKGKEVEYPDAEAFFLQAKIDYLRATIKKLDKSEESAEPEGERKDTDAEVKELQDELNELTKKQQQKKGTTPKQIDDASNPGTKKLSKAIAAARAQKFTYLWADNCCIDKKNNTELVEAISSMGDWYKNAKTCLVYIDDFKGESVEDRTGSKPFRYATRGWTMQEIVMTKKAFFFNKNWTIFGDTENKKVREGLAAMCQIPPELLCCGGKPDVGASAVLQLAARRRTFKPEDRAYSLMGMLGVRLRADYGEGQSKAVSRLFEAIIQNTSDVSIFNWSGIYAGNSAPGRSMYPTDFDGYDNVVNLDGDDGAYDYASAKEAKPAEVHSAVHLDHFGVHACFDVCPLDAIVEEDNRRALATVKTLERLLVKESNSDPANTYCSFNCEFTPLHGSKFTAEVLCSVTMLRQYLEYLHHPAGESPIKWVMARFAGVEHANWFLCEMSMKDAPTDEGWFAEVLQSSGQVGAIGPYMHYLESAGFPAKRIAMKWDSQKDFRASKKSVKRAYLWVG